MSAVERRPEIGWGRPAKADCSCRIRPAAPVVSDAETTPRHEHKTMEGFMSAFRNALLGLAALGAMAAPALADSPASYDGVMLFYPDSGRMMIVMSGGKAYIVDNMMDKMPDGSRMIDYFDKRTYGNF